MCICVFVAVPVDHDGSVNQTLTTEISPKASQTGIFLSTNKILYHKLLKFIVTVVLNVSLQKIISYSETRNNSRGAIN
jgi:hypothetical protein